MESKTICQNCGSEMGNSCDLQNSCPRCLMLLALGRDSELPRNIGPYEILQELSCGAMGIVYKAYDPSLNRIVALKVLPENTAGDKTFLKRFNREAQTAAHSLAVEDRHRSRRKR